jgi:hypothetical protein
VKEHLTAGSPQKGIKLMPLFALALLAVVLAGCSSSGSGGTVIDNGGSSSVPPTVTSPLSIFPPPDVLIARYYTDPSVIQSMKSDAYAIKEQFGGINMFSNAHYGTNFLTGTADMKDVFDSRIPRNLEIFRHFAWVKFGVKDAVNPADYYQRYAAAANDFIAVCGYDAVLLRPDQLDPILTDPVNDTWMLLRDRPSDSLINSTSETYIYSNRVKNLQKTLQGGMRMSSPDTMDADLWNEFWMYWIPEDKTGTAYTPYQTMIAADTASRDNGNSSSGARAVFSDYVPHDAGAEALQLRSLYGIDEAPSLSNRTVRVAKWADDRGTASFLQNDALSFSKNKLENYTWGGYGLYIIVLEPDYWIDPVVK